MYGKANTPAFNIRMSIFLQRRILHFCILRYMNILKYFQVYFVNVLQFSAHDLTSSKDARSNFKGTQSSAACFLRVVSICIAFEVSSRFLQAMMILHPWLIKEYAVSYPIPVLHPVIKATFPDKSLPCNTYSFKQTILI